MGMIFNQIFSWLLRTVIFKFVIFSILFFIVSEFSSFLISHLSVLTPDSLNQALSGFTPEIWFFVDLLRLDVGLPMIFSAYILRFSIRRIPIIG